MVGRNRAANVAAAVVIALTSAAVLRGSAADPGPVAVTTRQHSLRPVADTTVTQVSQDGDTGTRTTLATCPSLCEGNPNGRRDALLEFTAAPLPADAVAVRALLRVYAWHGVAARITVTAVPGGLAAMRAPGQTAPDGRGTRTDRVVKGYNEFDVSAAVIDGNYTFALQQETHHHRVYWGSRENSRPDLRPELVLSYRTAAGGAAAAVLANPAPTQPAPARSGPPVVAQPPGDAAPPAAQGWREVWSDDFNGPAIDRTKWNVRGPEGRDIDLGCNTDSARNSFTGGGHLIIRALRETTPCGAQTRAYSQAYLDTIGKFSWTYGRFEMRARSPNGPGNSRGLWPAFWLRPDDGGKGEIDVVELPGGDRWYDKATHAIFFDYSPVKQDTRTSLPSGGHPGDGFHTYTTEWEPGVLRWYIDGVLVWQRDRGTTPWFDAAFSRPFNIRLNFQVGGWLGTPDGATVFPADFVVDYVKVWQR